MMKLTEFALNFKVSERHARRLFQENESELRGHYDRRGREGTFLDDVAVDLLKSKLQKSFDVEIDRPSDREQQLQEQLTMLSMRYAAAMEKMAENAGAVALLEASKENAAKLEARAEEAEERAELRERENRELSLELERIRSEAQRREEEAKQLDEERLCVQIKKDTLQAQLDRIAGARWWERRKLLKRLKKEYKSRR